MAGAAASIGAHQPGLEGIDPFVDVGDKREGPLDPLATVIPRERLLRENFDQTAGGGGAGEGHHRKGVTVSGRKIWGAVLSAAKAGRTFPVTSIAIRTIASTIDFIPTTI